MHNTAGRWYHRRDEPAPRPPLAHVLVNLCSQFWASNFALGRLVRDDCGPFTLTAACVTVAGVVYTALLLRRPTARPAEAAAI